MSAPKRQRVAYSIDWLQVLCKSMQQYSDDIQLPDDFVSPLNAADGNHRWYETIEAKEYLHGYQYCKSIAWRGLVVAHVAYAPRSEYRDQCACAIKIANATLYCGEWYSILLDICAALMWHPIRITRCDLCADFNFFIGGLDPSAFLRKYVVKNKASYLRIGSNDFAVYGNKSNHATIFNSVRWGSRQNGVSVYMYNKTKELDEKKNKPWIRNMWQTLGLSSTKPIWRVEISINSEGCGLRELSSGVLHTLFVDDIATPDMARRMFQTYAAKYFRFVRTNPAIKHKKDLKEVQLLNLDEEISMKPCTITTAHDSGRREILVLRSLEDIEDTMRLIESPLNTVENRKAVAQLIKLYEELFAIKSREHHRNQTAKELAMSRVRNMMDEKTQYDNKMKSIYAQNLPEQRIRVIEKAVENELTKVMKEPPPLT